MRERWQDLMEQRARALADGVCEDWGVPFAWLKDAGRFTKTRAVVRADLCRRAMSLDIDAPSLSRATGLNVRTVNYWYMAIRNVAAMSAKEVAA